MSEDKVYKDGDIVWVKLGNSWWPGEVIGDEQRLPDEVQQLKKRPYCVVKFFQEDAYEYLKTAKHIYPFQCPKKNEFIKKGLNLYNAKNAFMKKFPEDVKHAESLTRPTTKIINVKEMWTQGLVRRSTDYYESNQATTSTSDVSGSQIHTTPRRDSVTTILNITPSRTSLNSETQTPNSASATSERTLSTSSTASIVTPNVAAPNLYRCNLCDFTTMRQNVLIMHRKSHNSSGGSRPSKPPATLVKPNSVLNSPSISDHHSNDNGTAKVIEKNEKSVSTSTPISTKQLRQQREEQTTTTPTPTLKKDDRVQKSAELTTSKTRNRKKATPTVSPSPRISSSTLKRTLRTTRSVGATNESTTPEVTVESIASKETSVVTNTLTISDDDVGDTVSKKQHHAGTVSPTDSKNSEQIRQRLLADWSDEEKEDNHENESPKTSRKGRPSNLLQLPTANVNSASVKRRSPTIVPMKTLEGAGQTLVVAASTQSHPNSTQEITTQRITQRIRNIPKKDRLRDFGSSAAMVDEQPKTDKSTTDSTDHPNADTIEQKEIEKLVADSKSVVSGTEMEIPVSCSSNIPNATLSCFDFQEEEEEEPKNDVLKSIANYKKKYSSPDKDKSAQSSSTSSSETNQMNKKVNAIEQRDKELSAEIDNLLEQTTVCITQTLKEDIIGFQPASVKGLPIKERGKRIFKSRNRAPIDDEDIQSASDVTAKAVEAPESHSSGGSEEIKQETNAPTVARSPATVERKTRGTSKRVRGKTDSKERNVTSSPVNGNEDKNKSPENVVSELTVQSVTELVYVSPRSRRKPYDNRIMRQVIEEDETSIPLIRHSPVELYSCDSSMDNGTHVVLRGRRSKTRTPNSLTGRREETVNGGGGGSRASSRSRNAVPLTPTDETSSLGVSDAGAEFGSPASSLDEERLLTPVQDADVDVGIHHDNEFKPISEGGSYTDIPADGGDVDENLAEDDEEIESPPHEGLSGNEMNEKELKDVSKRLKSPKKKLNSKDQEKKEVIERRKKRGETRSPNPNELAKSLTRDVIHKEDTDLVEKTTKATNEGSEKKVLKQDCTERRKMPARVSSRHAVVTKKEGDLEVSSTDLSTEDVKEMECALETDTSLKEKERLSIRSATESPTEKSVRSTDSKKHSPQQRRAKGSRSKTPINEPEIQRSEETMDSELVHGTSRDVRLPKEETDLQEVSNKLSSSPSPNNQEGEEQQCLAVCPSLDIENSASKECNLRKEIVSGDLLSAVVEQQIEGEKNISDEQMSALTPKQKSHTTTTEEIAEQLSCEAQNRSPKIPIKATPQSPTKKSQPSLETKSSNAEQRYTHQKDSSHSLPMEPLHIPEEILPLKDSANAPDLEVEIQQKHAKKLTRWDSPDKKVSSAVSAQSSEKRSGVLQNPDKKSNHWDCSYSPNKKSSSLDSSPSSLSPPKKSTRWDSPISTEKVKKLEDSRTETDKTNKTLTESTTPKQNSKSSPAKAPSEIKSITTTADGNGNGTDSEADHNPSLLSKYSSPKTSQPTTPAPQSSQIPSIPSLDPSPTIEKVRINVDVANPLSTQIANILAASGNSIHNQQQLQLSNRNRSPKLNASSPLKRKLSLEEINVVDAIASSDGDAVVAHVQSLCPQVKITRKERFIVPAGEIESIVLPSKKTGVTGSSTSNTSGHFDISQMPIVISNEQISTSKELSRSSSTSSSNSISVSNLWQTDLLQPPSTTTTTYEPASDNQGTLQHQHYRIGHDSHTTSNVVSPVTTTASSSVSSSRLNIASRSSLSPSPQKSPAASTGGRKQAGNIVTLPSSLTVKQHQHKFAEALSLADSVRTSNTKPVKRRSSQTTSTSTGNVANVNANRRLNSAPALDVRSTPPAKISRITTNTTNVEHIKSSPTKGVGQLDNSSTQKTWSQCNRQEQKQPKRLDTPSSEASIESFMEGSTLQAATSPSPTKVTNIEENQNVTDVEQINSTAKITAVPIQPIPGYAETFLLCMLVDNMYKPINNIPHYLNTDLNQLVPVPPEAYEGMLPELAVDQPPAHDAHETTNEAASLLGKTVDQHQQSAQIEEEMNTISQKTTQLLGTHGSGLSAMSSDETVNEEGGFKLVLQPGESPLTDAAVIVDPDITDGTVESASDNAIVLNLENQQIILDAATFEQLLANPDASTQLVTDDGTEFVLTREVLAALKAQHEGQNVELLAIPTDQQLQEQLIVPGVSITEAGSSSADLLSVALANSEFYGNDVLQIETTLGAGAGTAGLQLLASDGSIVFQAPPLPQAHLTPPITAHTSETNAVLNQTPIMSTLEKPSTAVMSGKGGIESPTAAVVSSVQCDMPGMRPNLDDSLAVIGVTTQSSTVPTSLELPITITNPAIAPKVTMAQSAHGADLVQFQPHRSVSTASAAAAAAAVATAHVYEDPLEGIN